MLDQFEQPPLGSRRSQMSTLGGKGRPFGEERPPLLGGAGYWEVEEIVHAPCLPARRKATTLGSPTHLQTLGLSSTTKVITPFLHNFQIAAASF